MTAPRLTASERDTVAALAFRIRCAAEHLQAIPPLKEGIAGESAEACAGYNHVLAETLRRLDILYLFPRNVCPDLPPWPGEAR